MRTAKVVEEILARNERARSDDKVLINEIMKSRGLFLSAGQLNILFDLPSFETVTRIRRKFQEKGEYLPTTTVRKARHHKALEVQQKMPQTKPQNVDKLLENRDATFEQPQQANLDLGIEPSKPKRNYF